MKRNSNQYALDAVKTLKDFCRAKECLECDFYHNDRSGSSCKLGTLGGPLDWDVPEAFRWSEQDKALAQALKLAGVERVERSKWKGYLILFSKNGLDVLSDTGKVLKAFKNLKKGEQITLDAIITE